MKGPELRVRKRNPPQRRYTAQNLKILWGRAAGRCAVSDCRTELFAEATDHDPVVVIGDIAHIEAASERGPRGRRRKAPASRHDYENLILLCKNCHARLDGQKRTNTVARIRQIKADHETWVRQSLPERGKGKTRWNVVLLSGSSPLDRDRCLEAIAPDQTVGSPLQIAVPMTPAELASSYPQMQQRMSTFLTDSDPFDRRFAVFPLAPVSACVALGYILTNRPHVQLFQYHRDQQAWAWPKSSGDAADIRVKGLPKKGRSKGGIVVCFELSATIEKRDVSRSLPGVADWVFVSVPRPTTSWLKSPGQLDKLGEVSRSVFESLCSLRPQAAKWHLLFAGPAPAAVRVGQQINSTMCPPVHLYEFRKGTKLVYLPSIKLGWEVNEQR